MGKKRGTNCDSPSFPYHVLFQYGGKGRNNFWEGEEEKLEVMQKFLSLLFLITFFF